MANTKFHISLDVQDLQESIRFYSVLFGTEPTKTKPDYAKFDSDNPGVVLTLEKGAPCCITGVSHMGVRVESTDRVLEAKAKLEAAGYATRTEENTACCYAVQDKVWVTDPTGYRWEVYTFKGDAEESPERSAALGSTCCAPKAQSAEQIDAKAAACCTSITRSEATSCC